MKLRVGIRNGLWAAEFCILAVTGMSAPSDPFGWVS